MKIRSQAFRKGKTDLMKYARGVPRLRGITWGNQETQGGYPTRRVMTPKELQSYKNSTDGIGHNRPYVGK